MVANDNANDSLEWSGAWGCEDEIDCSSVYENFKPTGPVLCEAHPGTLLCSSGSKPAVLLSVSSIPTSPHKPFSTQSVAPMANVSVPPSPSLPSSGRSIWGLGNLRDVISSVAAVAVSELTRRDEPVETLPSYLEHTWTDPGPLGHVHTDHRP